MVRTLDRDTRVLEGLLDEGSFVPIRTQVRARDVEGPAGDGVVGGEGRIDGRRVFVFEQDPLVLGGSLGEVHADSICRVLDLAGRFGAPVIGVHRSGGARIQEGVGALAGYGRIFARHVRLRNVVPQVALVAGACAGGAAYGPALMDLVILPRSDAYLFLTGPDVVREVTGEEVTFEELGGSRVAERSGLASVVAASADDLMTVTRDVLSYLPQRIGTPVAPTSRGSRRTATPARRCRRRESRPTTCAPSSNGSSTSARSSSSAPGARATSSAASRGSRARRWGSSRTSRGSSPARSTSKHRGRVHGSSSLCDRFGLPLAVFVDTPGFLPGTAQEAGGVIPAGAAFLSAFVGSERCRRRPSCCARRSAARTSS